MWAGQTPSRLHTVVDASTGATLESGTTAYDTMKIQVISGATTSTLVTYSNVGTGAAYAQKTSDLTACKGKTITVKSLMTEDSSLQTSFVVEDTSVTSS